ncbi:MAG: cytochrome d ubiquinol oxidase subunit II [Candidatus Omnitrophota bacterium]
MNFDLQSIWFCLIGVLLTGYVVLDGFDLGVGALHLFARDDRDRRLLLNSIGPVWDGNEVWLITAGGALFAAFPEVYATVFSGFYTAFILLLFSLIFRAVAIEFRSKQTMPWWRTFWDTSFCVASLLATVLIGVAFGAIAWGIALNEQGRYFGGLRPLIHPYTLAVALMAVSLFMMHGAIYLAVKTEGSLQDRARTWARRAWFAVMTCYLLTTLGTFYFVPHMVTRFYEQLWLCVIPVGTVLALRGLGILLVPGKEFPAFLCSCGVIVLLMTVYGIGMYPNLVISNPDPVNNLTIYNSASSEKTLGIMLVIACLGVPLVLAYTSSVYWIFRGKVRLDDTSY